MQVAFVLDGDPDDAQVVAWTTTPWTLPSNLSLCVHPEMIYVRVRRLMPAQWPWSLQSAVRINARRSVAC